MYSTSKPPRVRRSPIIRAHGSYASPGGLIVGIRTRSTVNRTISSAARSTSETTRSMTGEADMDRQTGLRYRMRMRLAVAIPAVAIATLGGWADLKVRTTTVVPLATGVVRAFRPAVSGQSNATLTAVSGVKVGHHTLTERPTGCTVILTEAGATASVDVRGSAPATRGTELLSPIGIVQQIHAITLSGGSAFGLDAASGVMRYLEEKGIGFPFGGSYVPTVPGASLFDLIVGDPKIRPTADCGDRAAKAATDAPVVEGNVGAGAGATVGKSGGRLDRAMKAGIGSAAITMPDGLVVAALVAGNAPGGIHRPATGKVVPRGSPPDGAGPGDR